MKDHSQSSPLPTARSSIWGKMHLCKPLEILLWSHKLLNITSCLASILWTRSILVPHLSSPPPVFSFCEALTSRVYSGQVLQTLEGENLLISRNGASVFVNNIPITSPDHQASNGVIHVIDGVLLPPSIGNFSDR